MLKIKKLVVGSLSTNCYVIFDDKSYNCLIIDPGGDSDYIADFIQSNNLTPIGIIATHAHFDHIMAVMDLKLIYKCNFYLHKKDVFLLKLMNKSHNYFWKSKSFVPIPITDKFLSDESKIKIDKYDINIIETPGHTPGSISILIKSINSIIVGDLMFKEGIGRSDLSYSSKSELLNSINKITSLTSKNTMIFPGHGEGFNYLLER